MASPLCQQEAKCNALYTGLQQSALCVLGALHTIVQYQLSLTAHTLHLLRSRAYQQKRAGTVPVVSRIYSTAPAVYNVYSAFKLAVSADCCSVSQARLTVHLHKQWACLRMPSALQDI